MSSQEKFIKYYTNYIKRDGAVEFLEWLKNTDFFTAPASTRFHLSESGGLCLHSLHVFLRLGNEVDFCEFKKKYTYESIAICGLLHDVCKANFYAESTRNVKNEQTGQWEKQPFYKVDDQFPFGHGEKSVFLIQEYMKLSSEEAMAINWHMGGFDARGAFAMGNTFDRYPLALLLHIADMKASHLDETDHD